MYIGSLYQLTPAQGSSGHTITVRIPIGSLARFRTTSVHRALFTPMTPPPGVSIGAPGITTFGYPATFQRIDDMTAIVVVPQIGTNPLVQMAPGLHKLVIATGLDWGDSATVFRALATAAAPAASLMPLPSASLPGPSVSTGPTPGLGGGMNPTWSGHAYAAPSFPAFNPSSTAALATGSSHSSPGAAPSPSPVEPPPERREMTVRWLSETFTPRRDGPGPAMIKPKGVTGLNGRIPVEQSSPPVRQFDFIISAQLRTEDQEPVVNQRVTWELLTDTMLPGDDTELLEVCDEFLPLKSKLTKNLKPSHTLEARTDQEGKTYCWMRLRLFDKRAITDPRQYLRGFKIVIGDPEEVEPGPDVTASTSLGPSTMMASTTVTGMGPSFAAAGANPPVTPWWQQLVNVLVEPFEQVAETGVRWVSRHVAEAAAALPRTWQEVLGFALLRFADGYLMMSGLYPIAMALGALEQARAAAIGAFLGLPRGIWVMARDQMQDIKALVFDLPRAVFNFIAEDPKFALEILASVTSPTLGQVIYRLDPEFQKRIDAALSRFGKLAAVLPGQIWQLWQMLTAMPIGDLVESIGGAIYSSFKEFVGDIATDYLRFAKDSQLYHFFVGGFIAGDFLGYVLGTVGVQVLAAYLTGGIATWVSGIAKIARAQRILGAVAGVIDKMIDVFRQIEAALKGLGAALKSGIGRVLLAFARFFDVLEESFIEPVVAAFHGKAHEMIRWLHRCFEATEPDQLGACARALHAKLAVRAGDARRVLHLLAGFAGRGFIAGC